jgi:hypothetical protein
MEPKISFELYETLEQNEHIEEVHFTADNQHYFNKHQLEGKAYGFLRTEQVKSHTVGEKQFYKMVQVPNPKTEIVVTLTREEVLAMEPVDEKLVFPSLRDRKKMQEAARKRAEALKAAAAKKAEGAKA